MLISESWLREWVSPDISTDALAELLTQAGLEVETVTHRNPLGDKVRVGEITKIEKHPDADKLTICQINIGSGIEQIVCGASNVTKARFVAVATIGTKLKGDFEIKPTTIRGVKKIGTDYSATLSH
jgi:phenylalanyl-tRNA synthetase beta chain